MTKQRVSIIRIPIIYTARTIIKHIHRKKFITENDTAIYIYINMNIFLHMNTKVWLTLSAGIYIYIYIIYLYMYIYLNLCINIYVYIFTHMNTKVWLPVNGYPVCHTSYEVRGSDISQCVSFRWKIWPPRPICNAYK